MAVNKVVYDGETLIDLTADTVTADSLLKGYTAHNAAGEVLNGAAVIPDKDYYIAVSAVLSGTSTVANITLPEEAEIKDGTIISFVTPAAGLNMTGIKVGNYTLDIVDGRNRSVLGQAGFFAKNCRVSVILDLTNSKAWLQNIAMIHVGDSVVNNFDLQTNATVNDAFDAVSAKLDNKADKTEVPTKTSELENDSGFITSDEVSKNVWYGTCDTVASTSAKVVTCEGFELKTGVSIKVKFKNYNSATLPTLNVNNTGVKNINIPGSGTVEYWWCSGQVVEFVYNGTNYNIITGQATTEYYGMTKLSSSTSSTSTATAATSSAVKQAYDLANGKATKSTYTATLSATGWSSSAPYTQSVSISGILATDMPHITPNYSSTNATAILEKKAWNMVGKAVTSAGKITFTCFEEKPEQAVSLAIEVIR